jgi:hypothetical protein
MNRIIKETEAVSDGIVVEFAGGIRCYFSANFLLQNVNRGSNRVFLDYDPTPAEIPDLLSTPSFSRDASLARSIREN